MEVAQRYQNALSRLTKSVKDTYTYFQPNYKRFNEFRRFVFHSSLTDDEKLVLDTLKKPKIEFNIGEAYISRLRGEFSKQEPSILVHAEDGEKVSPEVIDIVKAHLRHIIFEANRNSCEYNTYTDVLSGGFSAIKIWTEYAHEMSFDQVIKFDRVYDPSLVGFDPLARQSHKGDGRFCFELFPKSRAEFEQDYPDVKLNEIDFTRNVEGFSWSYSNNQEDILLICDFYEKKKKKKKIVKLANDRVMEWSEYKEFIEKWNEMGLIEQPPVVVGEPRWTEIETIVRYRFIENTVLEYVETDYPCLPIIFVDGNSIMMREGTNQGSFMQMTRPYIFNLKGIQKLKNFAGQTLANELENLVQHKFKVAKESLPDEQAYLDAYTNIQIANTLVYKAFKDNDPKQPVPPPMEIQRVPPPGEVINTFSMVDQMAQTILGSYDASLGINDNQLSGTAIVEGATQSNSAAMPYIVGMLQAYTRLAEIIVKLIPKYYVTPRTIPIVKEDGLKDYIKINQEGGVDFNFDSNVLSVRVEAGVNFAVQKAKTVNQIIAMSQAMPIFAQFMNAKGLTVLLDNLDIQGVEKLKELGNQFMMEMKQQQQMAMQQQQQQAQNNPMMIKAQNERMKIQMDTQKNANDNQMAVHQGYVDNQIRLAELAVEKQQVDNDFMKVMAALHSDKLKAQAAQEKSDAEVARASVDLAMKHVEMTHSHIMDHVGHQLKIKELNEDATD